MITFVFNGEKVNMGKELSLGLYIRENALENSVLACKVNGRIRSVDYIVQDGDEIKPLTIKSDEGYLIYKETLIILLLKESRILCPYILAVVAPMASI